MTKKIEGFILLQGDSKKIKNSMSYLKDYEVLSVVTNTDENETIIKIDMEKPRFEYFWETNVHAGLLKKSVVKGF